MAFSVVVDARFFAGAAGGAERSFVALTKSDFVAQFRIVRLDTGEIRWIEVRGLITYGQRPTSVI